MRRRAAVAIACTTGAVALLVGLRLSTAQAHVPVVAASCDGLSVELTRYAGTGNTVSVTIDGVRKLSTFDQEYRHTFGWSADARHAWIVVIDGHEQGSDRTFSGVQMPCTTTTGGGTLTTTTIPSTSISTTSTHATTPPTSGVTSTSTKGTTNSSVPITTTSTPIDSVTTTSRDVSQNSTVNTAATTTTVARPTLPQTGNNAALLAVLAGLVLLVGASMAAVRRRT